jgi:hypothetical protein
VLDCFGIVGLTVASRSEVVNTGHWILLKVVDRSAIETRLVWSLIVVADDDNEGYREERTAPGTT